MAKVENPSTGTQSSVAASATSVLILAKNTGRQGALIYNDSTQVLYLLLANDTASTSNFSVKVSPDDTFVLDERDYTGAVYGVWAAAAGNARVTEFA